MKLLLARNFLKVYTASRRQESSTLRNSVRLIGWVLVVIWTVWQGELDPETLAAIMGVSESIAALIGIALPDRLKQDWPPVALPASPADRQD